MRALTVSVLPRHTQACQLLHSSVSFRLVKGQNPNHVRETCCGDFYSGRFSQLELVHF